MPIKISADGFELTPALREACENITKDKLLPIAQQNLKTNWTLSVIREEQIVHLTWSDGSCHGEVNVKSTDMYNSIHQSAKKASEQMKKSHEKKKAHHVHDKSDSSLHHNKNYFVEEPN